MLQIGSLKLENRLVMAPLAGITNLPFRLMVKKWGAGLVTTEMVSAMGLIRDHKKTFGYLESHPEEKPLAVQIFGSDPTSMARAAQIVVEAGANLVDLNMGCPVKKVVKTGAGASLLREPKRVAEIVAAVRLACPVPLTIKIRTGWSPERPVACEIARIAEDCGADAVTIHPRFATDRFSGLSDWTWIEKVKSQLNIPVIGNGDVTEPSLALKMRRETGCDGVMIGRAAVGNPWLFNQILCLEQGRPVPKTALSERRSMIMAHFQALSQSMGERRAILCMRGILLRYTKGLPHSSRFRGSITKMNHYDDLVATMDQYFGRIKETEH